MPRVIITRPSPVDGRFQVHYSLDKGESLPISYVMTPKSGNADIPSAAVLTVAASRGDAAIYTAACTITDGTTTYTVAHTIPAATIAGWLGVYVFSIEETHSSFTAKPVQGEIAVRQSVEVEP